MDQLTLECSLAEKDLVSAELFGAGTLGIAEEEIGDGRVRLRAWFESAAEIAADFEEFQPVIEPADQADWVGISRAQWQPITAGDKFFLVPEWREDPTPAGRLRLVMPAGGASGTGLHPATRLALRAAEIALQTGETVLDLGTGSGILSAGARLLGAATVLACDIDEQAAHAAREYLRDRGVLVYAGSTHSLRNSSVDVVLANLSAPALAALAGEITRVLRQGGRAVLSGFTAEKPPRLDRGLLEVAEEFREDGWAAWIARRTAKHAREDV